MGYADEISKRFWVVLSLFLFLVGCGEGPQPRLSALLGTPMAQHQQPGPTWPSLQRIGLVVHSDATRVGAAPPISQPFLETLSRRTEKVLTQRCRVSSVVPIDFPSSTQHEQIRRGLMARGQEQGISHLLLVGFSGQEHSGPATLGEETMMTQITGTVVEHTAQVEVALLDLSTYQILLALPARATETLELLDVPIGSGQPTREQSLDILRAQAGQQALDRSLNLLGQWCEGIPVQDLG